MIDPLTEQLISPSAATRIFPLGANGRHPHVSFIYRAMKWGCRGIRLEFVKLPKIATSKEAVARFIAQLSDVDEAQKPNGTRQLFRESTRVEQELDDIGL